LEETLWLVGVPLYIAACIVVGVWAHRRNGEGGSVAALSAIMLTPVVAALLVLATTAKGQQETATQRKAKYGLFGLGAGVVAVCVWMFGYAVNANTANRNSDAAASGGGYGGTPGASGASGASGAGDATRPAYSAEYLQAHPQANSDAPVQPPADWREKQAAGWKGKSIPRLSPGSFGRSTPERAVAEFVAGWQAKDYAGMVAASQVSWRRREAQPARMLSSWFGLTTVRGARIIRTEQSGEAARRVTVEVFGSIPQSAPTVDTYTVMVVREGADGSPSRSGKWGVNPRTALQPVSTRPL
jgi:hypothetical protein